MLVTLENQVFPVLGVGGGPTDFLKNKKNSNKSKICTHSEFTLLLGGRGEPICNHSVSLVFRGMGCISVFYILETTLHLGKRRGG